MNQFHSLRVASLAHETRDAVVVTFEVPEALTEIFRFTHGQSLTMRTHLNGEEIRRSYSICAAPFENKLRVAIKRVPDGVFSNWANKELQPGQTIECMTPVGSFGAALEPAVPRHHLAFAAGSGITPVLSILKSVLQQEPLSRFTLLYGNRSSSSVIFKEELEDLKDRYLDRFRLIFILSREHQDIDLLNGRIDRAKTDQLLKHWIDPVSIDIAYICGPQSMIEEVSASLLANGMANDRIRVELFNAQSHGPRKLSAAPETSHQESWITIVQDGRRREFVMPRNEDTILDAALEQGIELPYSCKGGVCSTCRCKITSGEVDMDVHFALEDYEVARGFILTCQSYPLSEQVVLDFDQES